MLGDARRPRLYTEEQYFKSAAKWSSCLPIFPKRSRTRWKSPSAAICRSRSARATCRISRRRPGVTLDDFLRQEAASRPRSPPAAALPRPAERAAQRPAYDARLQLETDTIVQMGFPGYFLIVADFINWAKHNGCPVGPGAARAPVRWSPTPRHHRPRSAALRAALRALPQPRAGVDARLRHRLLPGQPLAGDRVRAPEVRRGGGVADRHLRHHVVEGGHSRRRARARPAVQLLRPAFQADPGRNQQAAVAGQGDRRRAATARPGSTTRKKSGISSTSRPPRRSDAQRRHARRRRADRARQADRLLPGLFGRRRRLGGFAVRQGRRREGRPGEVRLPRPAQPDDHQAGGRLRRAAERRTSRSGERCPSTIRRPTRFSRTATPRRSSRSNRRA
jgi:hypothetical protein